MLHAPDQLPEFKCAKSILNRVHIRQEKVSKLLVFTQKFTPPLMSMPGPTFRAVILRHGTGLGFMQTSNKLI